MKEISKGFLNLAKKLQQDSDGLIERAESDPELFLIAAEGVAGAMLILEKTAAALDNRESPITVEDLQELVNLANELDKSEDEKLIRQASVIDEILLTISAPKNAVAQAKAGTEDEVNRLREEYRGKAREKLYNEAREEEDGRKRKADISKAVKEQVKRYRPMEAALSSRYCPDHHGVSLIRIADKVYQCSLDHKIYNYETGYTTAKGNKVPGGRVENQTPNWSRKDVGHVMFNTRDGFVSRFSADQSGEINKTAESHDKLPFELTEDEESSLSYIADRYDSAKALYEGWDPEEQNIRIDDVKEAFYLTVEDGADLGNVPLAGGTLKEKIDKLFDQVLDYVEDESEYKLENGAE